MTFEKWVKVALFNLLIVALLGVTLRYKIAFSLPFIDQKNLMHSHSHFAFGGWISHILMLLLVYYLQIKGQKDVLRRYRTVLISNAVTAYGMLIFFPFLGYSFITILFSTLAIFVSYAFAIMYWKDLNRLPQKDNCHLWFKSALIFSVISSIGPFTLAYILSNHLIDQKLYLGSVYCYLHFQYNGWFLFVCLGLFIFKVQQLGLTDRRFNYIFWIFAICCFPTLFLSMPWLNTPVIVTALCICAAIMQGVAWVWLLMIVYSSRKTILLGIPNFAKYLWLIAAISFSIKLVLQLGSAYHPLSQLVFGFRPIVIGYLHLVFLGVISVFIFGFIVYEKFIPMGRSMNIAIAVFVSGIFANELFLMLQGLLALGKISIPHINIYLLAAAVWMFLGVLMVNVRNLFR